MDHNDFLNLAKQKALEAYSSGKSALGLDHDEELKKKLEEYYRNMMNNNQQPQQQEPYKVPTVKLPDYGD